MLIAASMYFPNEKIMPHSLEQVALHLAEELGVILAPRLSGEEKPKELWYWKVGMNKKYVVEYRYDAEMGDESLIVCGRRKKYPRMTVVRLSRPHIKLAVVVSVLYQLFGKFQEKYRVPPDKSCSFYAIGVELSRQIANPPKINPKASKKMYARCFDAKLPTLELVTKELVNYYVG